MYVGRRIQEEMFEYFYLMNPEIVNVISDHEEGGKSENKKTKHC